MTWIVIANYVFNDTTFYQFRLCVESILREVPRGDYVRLLIVDDHSMYDYTAFREHYRDDDRIEFLMLGSSLPSYYGPKGHGIRDQGIPTSEGPGVATHKGVLYAIEHGAEYAWTLDADTLILDGSCLKKALEVIQQLGIIRSVGDYAWGRPRVRDSLCFGDHKLVNGTRQDKVDSKEGKTNAICSLWSLEDYNYPFENRIPWGKDKVGDTFVARFENMGQTGTRVVEGIWSNDWATAYFPFLWGSYVMHFGCGVLMFTREQDKARGVGNAPDAKVRYGNKSQSDYYAGFLQLKCTTKSFHKHLQLLFQNRPFSDVSARFDRSLLVAPEADA